MRSKSILLVVVASLLSGCYVHEDSSQYVTPEYSGTRISINKFITPVSGDFYVTYIPMLFVETEDVRKARDAHICAHIESRLSSCGLTPSDSAGLGPLERPFYVIRYYYHTTASWYPEARGWHHEMWISIFDMDKEEYVWRGNTWVDCQRDKDISGFLSVFIYDLFEDFPNKGRQTQGSQ